MAAGGQAVGVGDEIVTCRNDRRLLTTSGGWVRNGDRWAVTARHPNGALAVSHLAGHGDVVLPADYVALAYAVTVHKAQGVTVDRAVLIADETTTAEALYVGMTRGRHTNTTLVVCDRLDSDCHDAPAASTEILAQALTRISAESAALAELRAALAASESLAVLASRLANVQAWIDREMPPNPAVDLQRLAARRAHLERHARPGLFTRTGRDTRRLLRELDRRQQQLEAAAEHQQAWLVDHADTLAYRDDLTGQATARRAALELHAVTTQPAHLVDLLGAVPDDDAGRSRWARFAARIEAYRRAMEDRARGPSPPTHRRGAVPRVEGRR